MSDPWRVVGANNWLQITEHDCIITVRAGAGPDSYSNEFLTGLIIQAKPSPGLMLKWAAMPRDEVYLILQHMKANNDLKRFDSLEI